MNVVDSKAIESNDNNTVHESNVVGNKTVESNIILDGITDNYTVESNGNSNIVEPDSSPLVSASSCGLESNIFEPGSSSLGSSDVSALDVVMEGASDARKRPLAEVSSDGDSLDDSVMRSKLPVRKTKGVWKVPAPTPSVVNPRVTRSSSAIPGLSTGPRFAMVEWAHLARRS